MNQPVPNTLPGGTRTIYRYVLSLVALLLSTRTCTRTVRVIKPFVARRRLFAARRRHETVALARVLTLATTQAATASTAVRQLLVPAYFYSHPSWDELKAALEHVKITAIMNPASAGTAANSDYSAAVDAFRAAGGVVLGYVHSS
jgi:hypothetical protein